MVELRFHKEFSLHKKKKAVTKTVYLQEVDRHVLSVLLAAADNCVVVLKSVFFVRF